MVSTAPDDEIKRDARAVLAQQIDRKITYALHLLGESGAAETGPLKFRLRHRGARENAIYKVRSDFGDLMETWKSGDPEKDQVLFFEFMRKRCYDLYDKTNAWDTITALTRAVTTAITPQLENEASPDDRVILQAIRRFLRLLDVDMAIYKAVNRGQNHSVIANCWTAQQDARELLELLGADESGDGPAEFTGNREELRKELIGEARALHEVYRGIRHAAVALADHEDAIRKYYDEHPGSYDRPGDQPWPDHRVIRNLDDAHGLVRSIIDRLEEAGQSGTRELSPEAGERAGDIASRLNPWASLLRSVATAYRDSKPMRLPTVQIRYCFPFAVKVGEDRLGQLSSALRKRVPGTGDKDDGSAGADNPEVVPGLGGVLDKRLKDLDQGSVTLQTLELTDFWAGAGEGMYGGQTASLPGLWDKHHPGDEWRVWVDLSRLENHCLCIERTLTDPTPHELYKALRCPADYARDVDYRYGWAEHGYWRGLDEFAHDVILVVAQGLAGEDDPEYIKGHFHIMILVDADVSIAELDGRYGAEILRTNVNRDAATLEEWVRYPVTERKGKPETAQGNFGYKENSWSVLDDTTIFGVAGNPSWQATAYLEAVQFAASWTPRLLLWNRELLQALEDRPGKKNDRANLLDLRQLEQTVRRSVAFAHAEELCRLRSDRRYLEWMMEAVGTTSIQEDLERRIHTMRLLITENEKKEQDRRDGRRNFFLGAIAIFGVLNVSTFFAVLDAGDQNGFFKSHAAIQGELVAQVVIIVLVIAIFAGMELRKRR